MTPWAPKFASFVKSDYLAKISLLCSTLRKLHNKVSSLCVTHDYPKPFESFLMCLDVETKLPLPWFLRLSLWAYMTPTLLASFYHEDLMNDMLFSWNFLNIFRNGLTYELMLKRRHLCVILGLNLHVKYHDGRFCFVGCHENEHPQWEKQYFGFNYF